MPGTSASNSASAAPCRAGIDSSGTFTDLAGIAPDGSVVAAEHPSTPREPMAAFPGAILCAVKWTIDGLGLESFRPGDVVMHNDPYRRGCMRRWRSRASMAGLPPARR